MLLSKVTYNTRGNQWIERVVAFKTEEREKFVRSSGVTSKMGYYCEEDIKESQILT